MRQLIFSLFCCLMFQPVLAEKDPMLNQGEQAYLFVAIWAPNIDDQLVHQFIIEEFQNQYPDANVTPVLYRTNDVLSALMTGFAHVGITARQWSDKEVTLLQKKYNGKKPLELTLSADAFAIAINKDNPVRSLSIKDIQGVFSQAINDCEFNSVNDWKQLGVESLGDGQSTKLAAYSYKSDARTTKVFNNLLCGENMAQQLESKSDALSKVESEVNAVTFVPFNIEEMPESFVAIKDFGGKEIPARLDTVFSGEYPLSTVYYLQVAPFALDNESIKLYMDYLLDENTQSLLQEKGFARLPEQIILRNKVKMNQVKPVFANGYR